MTLAIAAFNQERFVRAAVEGAFAQTYSPLEIILSDDKSKDRTWEIMQEMTANYRGPHHIILSQGTVNGGLAAHVNRIFEVSHGELVIMNAGDDISLPHRVAATVAAWKASGGKSAGVHSRVLNMDQAGRIKDNRQAPTQLREGAFVFEDGIAALKQFMHEEKPVILGCSAAWSREMFMRFGPLPLDVVFEDVSLGFRARLCGGMAFIDDPLVLYRLHDANIHHVANTGASTVASIRDEQRRRVIGLERRMAAARSFTADLELAARTGMFSGEELNQIKSSVAGFTQSNKAELKFRKSGWLGRLSYYSELRRNCPMNIQETAKLWHQLLPRWLYYGIRLVKAKLRGTPTAHSTTL
ncbi:MAG: glycosyltransferase [Verrucomicrobiales bacterium]|nr:MAG: glycosyltransferase [Verrucomicrobiales bacterium]